MEREPEGAKKRVSILFVCRGPFGQQGVAATYMFPTTLARQGHNIHVISFEGAKDETPAVYQQHGERISFHEYISLGFLARAAVVRKHIAKLRPDIVHCFKIPKYYLLPFLCKTVGPRSPKWLIDLRSPPVYDTPPGFAFFKRARIAAKKKAKVFYQLGFDAILTHALPSAYENFGKISRPLYEVPLGVEPSMIRGKQWDKTGANKTPLRFVYAGAIAKNRRLETLIEAIRICKDRRPQGGFEVDFFGGGDFVDGLRDMVDSLGLAGTVYYRGVVRQADLFERLCEYDVGIGYVPYEQYMQAPALKVLEYMAANLLVVASDTEGIKKQVIHNVNGLLFKNTPESIADTILSLVDGGIPVSLAEAGYGYALENSWERIVANKLLPVYRKLMESM